jgi:hypothetical protein
MKLCIWVGLANVKVGLVCREMNTLLEFILVVPTWTRAALAPTGVVGVEGVDGVDGVEGVEGVGGVITTGVVDWQIEG